MDTTKRERPSDLSLWSNYDVRSHFGALECLGADRDSVMEALLEHKIDGVYIQYQDKSGWQQDAANLLGMHKAGVIFRVWYEMLNLRKGKNQEEPAQTIGPVPANLPKGEMPDVMISLHAGSSSSIAKQLDEQLRLYKFTSWMCLHMNAGLKYRREIVTYASRCKVMVILLNEPWAKSKECEFEANIAFRKLLVHGSPTIIPLVLQNFEWGSYPHVDAIMLNTKGIVMEDHDIAGLCQRLIKSLQSIDLCSKTNDNVVTDSDLNVTDEAERQLQRAITWDFAAARGQTSTLNALLKDGMDINSVTKYNDTALMLAARGGIQTLLHMTRYGGGPRAAAWSVLNAYGITDETEQKQKLNRTRTEQKAEKGPLLDDCITTAKFLISRGINMDTRTKGGDTALSLAAYYEIPEIVACILEFNSIDSIMKSIDRAIHYSSPESKKLLLAWKHGRYRIDDGPPVHKSATCCVVFAEDMLSTSDDTKRVALKKMKNKNEFYREITSRFAADADNIDDCTIGLLGWHVPDDRSSLANRRSTLKPGIIEAKERPERLGCEDEYKYTLVLERGAASLWHALGTQRVAGHTIDTIVNNIFAPIVTCVQRLHSHKLVHSDLKPRNILRKRDKDQTIVLCDMDAALKIGEERTNKFKCSTGYCAPEFARYYFNAADGNVPAPSMTTAYDVWSLGVLLFELCTGQHLFSQDISDDNLVNDIDKAVLSTWHTIPDDQLDLVFPSMPKRTKLVEDAKDLIRACLKGRPSERPSTQDILDHPFLNDNAPRVANRQSMKFHGFLSHAQGDASGTAGTLYSLHKNLGVHLWYDMRARDLNLSGMKRGVQDSDIIVIVLTRTTLSRWFCRQEILEAIDLERGIQIILEEDLRFKPFDIQFWMSTKMVYDSNGIEFKDSESPEEWGKVVKAIDDNLDNAIPYRRRAYEQDGMMREICKRCNWSLPAMAEHRALTTLKILPTFTVFVVYNSANSGRLIFEDICQAMSISCPNIKLSGDPADAAGARNCLLILTTGVLELHGNIMLRMLREDKQSGKNRFVHMYQPVLWEGVRQGDAWVFGGSEQKKQKELNDAIDCHEALPYRRNIGVDSRYRHEFAIMMNELYRLLEWSKS